jgi:hypothetical protein
MTSRITRTRLERVTRAITDKERDDLLMHFIKEARIFSLVILVGAPVIFVFGIYLGTLVGRQG